jgi:tetratricopeptide (TPR) repeat protein
MWLIAAPVLAAERVALVIGNGNYAVLPDLPNPKHDAAAVAAQLQGLGFTLVGDRAHVDVSKAQLSTLLIDFQQALKPGDLGLFYYAGHGAAHGGRNYLLPVDDTGLRWREQLPDLAYDAGRVLETLQSRGRGVNLIVLDACRDNPLPPRDRERTGQTERGLLAMAPAAAEQNLQFLYAAGPGQRALDGKGNNSPFTLAFLEALRTPGLSWEALMKATAREVQRLAPEAPLPYWEGRLLEEVVLHPGTAPVLAPVTPDVATDVAAMDAAACDALAAASTDPQLPAGITGVKPGQIDGPRAVAACRPVALYSTDSRHWFQFGRALDANGDDAEAVRWYRKAAEAGHAAAMNNLGVMYERGRGVTQDDGEAVRWYRKAAEAGDETARENLQRLGKG